MKCDHVQLSFSFNAWHSHLVQENRQDSTGSAIAGYLIWDEIPDRWVALGANVIIASGLFVVYREIGGAISSRYLRALTASSAAAVKRRLNRKLRS